MARNGPQFPRVMSTLKFCFSRLCVCPNWIKKFLKANWLLTIDSNGYKTWRNTTSLGLLLVILAEIPARSQPWWQHIVCIMSTWIKSTMNDGGRASDGADSKGLRRGRTRMASCGIMEWPRQFHQVAEGFIIVLDFKEMKIVIWR